MSLSEQISDIWIRAGYAPPNVKLIYHENEYMIVIDDSTSFLRFMSTDGQIFIALNRKCQIGSNTQDEVYVCDKVDAILCSPVKGPGSDRDFFVLANIIPLL